MMLIASIFMPSKSAVTLVGSCATRSVSIVGWRMYCVPSSVMTEFGVLGRKIEYDIIKVMQHHSVADPGIWKGGGGPTRGIGGMQYGKAVEN